MTILLAIEFFSRKYLFALSLPISETMRTVYQSPNLDLLFKIISEFGDKYVNTFIVTLSFLYMDFDKAFIMTLVNNVALGVLSLLKGLLMEPRPFHVIPGLQPTKCDFEFGNPSGHSLAAASIYFTFL